MPHRMLTMAAVLALFVSASAQADAPGEPEAMQDLMYSALCRGILWPDSQPTLLASDGEVADVGLEIATRDAIAHVAEMNPGLADDLADEAEAGSDWRFGMAASDPAALAQTQAECRIHLEATLYGE